MKNIHVLKTSKPSKIGRFIDTNTLFIRTPTDIPRGENVEIYITNDEEIKEGDWYIYKNNIVQRKTINDCSDGSQFKKIILTTNDQAIQDGVQKIDNEFLEWFVKNPSYEDVKVNPYCEKLTCQNNECKICCQELKYKIIIPQKQSKQEKLYTQEQVDDLLDRNTCQVTEQVLNSKKEQLNYKELSTKFTEKLNSVTIEEAAGKVYQKALEDDLELTFHDGVKLGVELQQERSISKEAYEDSLNMQRTSNAGYESKINELKDEIKRSFSEKDMLDFAWFFVKNLGQYPNDEKAHFEGKYLEKFRNK